MDKYWYHYPQRGDTTINIVEGNFMWFFFHRCTKMTTEGTYLSNHRVPLSFYKSTALKNDTMERWGRDWEKLWPRLWVNKCAKKQSRVRQSFVAEESFSFGEKSRDGGFSTKKHCRDMLEVWKVSTQKNFLIEMLLLIEISTFRTKLINYISISNVER